jgi:hypothetical protein
MWDLVGGLLVIGFEEDFGTPALSSSSLFWISPEMNNFALPYASIKLYYLSTGPKATEPTNHELKPPEF